VGVTQVWGVPGPLSAALLISHLIWGMVAGRENAGRCGGRVAGSLAHWADVAAVAARMGRAARDAVPLWDVNPLISLALGP
jgi:hypothetical protein